MKIEFCLQEKQAAKDSCLSFAAPELRTVTTASLSQLQTTSPKLPPGACCKADVPFAGHPCWVERTLNYSLAALVQLMRHLPWLVSCPSWEVLWFSGPPCWDGAPLAVVCWPPLPGWSTDCFGAGSLVVNICMTCIVTRYALAGR